MSIAATSTVTALPGCVEPLTTGDVQPVRSKPAAVANRGEMAATSNKQAATNKKAAQSSSQRKTAAGDSQCPTHPTHGPGPGLAADVGVLHCGPLPKMDMAFFRISTSARRRSFSRWIRASSAIPSGSLPWPGNASSEAFSNSSFQRETKVWLIPSSRAMSLPLRTPSITGAIAASLNSRLNFLRGPAVQSPPT